MIYTIGIATVVDEYKEKGREGEQQRRWPLPGCKHAGLKKADEREAGNGREKRTERRQDMLSMGTVEEDEVLSTSTTLWKERVAGSRAIWAVAVEWLAAGAEADLDGQCHLGRIMAEGAAVGDRDRCCKLACVSLVTSYEK